MRGQREHAGCRLQDDLQSNALPTEEEEEEEEEGGKETGGVALL